MFYGADTRARQRSLIALLSRFEVVYLERDDQEWAMRQLPMFRLSHGIDVPDSLIAAPCYRLGLPLDTRNLKHFAPLLGGLARQPCPIPDDTAARGAKWKFSGCAAGPGPAG